VGLYAAAVALLSLVVARGPTLPDRVLAADVILYNSAVILALAGVILGSKSLVACVIVVVLWAYALDIYFSKYAEGGELGVE